MSAEEKYLPRFDGSEHVEDFLQAFEAVVLRECRLEALKMTLQCAPAQWWGLHGQTFQVWEECRNMLVLRFETLAHLDNTSLTLRSMVIEP